MWTTTLHPVLTSHLSLQGLFQRHPTINWDVRRSTSTASISSHYSSHYWSEPATSPAIASMRLVFNIPSSIHSHSLVWQTDVYNKYGVRVRDVLEAIHNALYRRLSPLEWASFGRHYKERVGRALLRRMTDYPRNNGYYSHSDGARRVDCLLNETRFSGLKRSSDIPQTWIVQFRHSYR